MSNIPTNALSPFTPGQIAANEAVRARKVQSRKDAHHAEEVEELDDTAVDSVRDQQQNSGRREKDKRQKRRSDQGERVDIESLRSQPQPLPASSKKISGSASHLDISA